MDENGERQGLGRRGIDGHSGGAERERPVSTDQILSAVGNDYRRAILDSLDSASDKTLAYETLVDRVADKMRTEGPPRADEHRQRVRIALYHTHLPKLEAARIVDYDVETGTVRFVGGELEQDLLALVGPHDGNE